MYITQNISSMQVKEVPTFDWFFLSLSFVLYSSILQLLLSTTWEIIYSYFNKQNIVVHHMINTPKKCIFVLH